MQKTTFCFSVAAFVVALCALWRTGFQPGQPALAGQKLVRNADTWREERNYPPLVFTSQAWLDCSISSTKNGRQIMTTTTGQGFSFSTAMLPIKKGILKVNDPGMLYKFNAFPTGVIPARFNGLGEGRITEMKAEIEVDVKRYQQPGGPGTEIQFNAGDIARDAAYVEFTGLFVRNKDKKRFPFRLLFGSVQSGVGRVKPASADPDTTIMAKTVVLGSQQQPATVTTALYEAEDDVRPLK